VRRDEPAQTLELGSPNLAAQQGPFGPPHITPKPSPKGIDIYADDLWNYIRVAFLSDHVAGRTRVCANPECVAPYFLASRKDQRLCREKECAAWAQREWALAWWKETGNNRRRRNRRKSPKLKGR